MLRSRRSGVISLAVFDVSAEKKKTASGREVRNEK